MRPLEAGRAAQGGAGRSRGWRPRTHARPEIRGTAGEAWHGRRSVARPAIRGPAGDPWPGRRSVARPAIHGPAGDPWHGRRSVARPASRGPTGDPWPGRRVSPWPDRRSVARPAIHGPAGESRHGSSRRAWGRQCRYEPYQGSSSRLEPPRGSNLRIGVQTRRVEPRGGSHGGPVGDPPHARAARLAMAHHDSCHGSSRRAWGRWRSYEPPQGSSCRLESP